MKNKRSSSTYHRKNEHIQLSLSDREVDRGGHFFSKIQLSHRALPELNWDDVDTSCIFLGHRLSFPFLISSMTGGGNTLTYQINQNLARAAEICQVAFAVGSQRIMLEHPETEPFFSLRDWAPTTLLFANIGAVQLNYGCTLADCQHLLEITGADGLYFHLNPLQEIIQPEGQRNFRGLAEKIGKIAQNLSKPVLIKEVGTGLSLADIQRLLRFNIRIFDVAGRGGTSWSRIEHHRRQKVIQDNLGLTFQDWGIPTPYILKQLLPFRDQLDIIASGGIRNGIDMVRAIILGARLCGIAYPLLQAAQESVEAVVNLIQQWKLEFHTAMFLLGVSNVDQLRYHLEYIEVWNDQDLS